MKNLDYKNVVGIAALLVHAAKIDELYSNQEKDLIKKFIKSYLKEGDENLILKEAEEIEIIQINYSALLILLKKIMKK